ncbi:MAG: hypothetical protein AABY46_08180 [Nitrospirota bacterium]
MRIVDRRTFLALPAGTLFSKYVPCIFESLKIKGDSTENDFHDQSIEDAVRCSGSEEFEDVLFAAQRDGTSFAMDFDSVMRDGLYDKAQLFAVWEPSDVVALIERLKLALQAASSSPR